MNNYYNQIFYKATDNSVVIEEDGNTCYAYLMVGEEITGDVWLYNSKNTPNFIDLNEDLPYPNPSEYTDNIFRISNEDYLENISIDWSINANDVKVSIEFGNGLKALLKTNLFPGYTNNVKKDGPLALSLHK